MGIGFRDFVKSVVLRGMNRAMKIPALVLLGLLVSGCNGGGSSNDEESQALTGTWQSNCYELFRSGDGKSLGYYIDTYNFTEGAHTLDGIEYTDAACTTPTGAEDNYFGDVTLGEILTAEDGTQVTRITMTQSAEYWAPTIEPVVIEGVYRISGGDLHFGTFVEGQTPALVTTPVYTRQAM